MNTEWVPLPHKEISGIGTSDFGLEAELLAMMAPVPELQEGHPSASGSGWQDGTVDCGNVMVQVSAPTVLKAHPYGNISGSGFAEPAAPTMTAFAGQPGFWLSDQCSTSVPEFSDPYTHGDPQILAVDFPPCAPVSSVVSLTGNHVLTK